MIAQYTAAALASENKVLAHPASADSIPTSANQEDHVSMGPIVGPPCPGRAEHVEQIVAIELLVAAQALDPRLALLAGTRGGARAGAASPSRASGGAGRSGPSGRWPATGSPDRTSRRPRALVHDGALVDLAGRLPRGRRPEALPAARDRRCGSST